MSIEETNPIRITRLGDAQRDVIRYRFEEVSGHPLDGTGDVAELDGGTLIVHDVSTAASTLSNAADIVADWDRRDPALRSEAEATERLWTRFADELRERGWTVSGVFYSKPEQDEDPFDTFAKADLEDRLDVDADTAAEIVANTYDDEHAQEVELPTTIEGRDELVRELGGLETVTDLTVRTLREIIAESEGAETYGELAELLIVAASLAETLETAENVLEGRHPMSFRGDTRIGDPEVEHDREYLEAYAGRMLVWALQSNGDRPRKALIEAVRVARAPELTDGELEAAFGREGSEEPAVIVPGVVFETPFESGCVVVTYPDESGEFLGIDSDGVECSYVPAMGITRLGELELRNAGTSVRCPSCGWASGGHGEALEALHYGAEHYRRRHLDRDESEYVSPKGDVIPDARHENGWTP